MVYLQQESRTWLPLWHLQSPCRNHKNLPNMPEMNKVKWSRRIVKYCLGDLTMTYFDMQLGPSRKVRNASGRIGIFFIVFCTTLPAEQQQNEKNKDRTMLVYITITLPCIKCFWWFQCSSRQDRPRKYNQWSKGLKTTWLVHLKLNWSN